MKSKADSRRENEQPLSDKILLSVTEASQCLSISRSKLYDLISQQRIPYVKLGKGLKSGVRFRVKDLLTFANDNLVRPGA